MPKNTTKCPQPGPEPGPLDPESSALTMRPPCDMNGLKMKYLLVVDLWKTAHINVNGILNKSKLDEISQITPTNNWFRYPRNHRKQLTRSKFIIRKRQTLFVCLLFIYLFEQVDVLVSYTADVDLLYPPIHTLTKGQPQHRELKGELKIKMEYFFLRQICSA